MWRERFDWYPSITRNALRPWWCQYIFSQKKRSHKQAAFWNIWFTYVFLCPTMLFISQICSKCIHFVSYSALYLLLLLPVVSTEWGRNALSFCNLPKQVTIYPHGKCEVSKKANSESKECDCVWKEGADLGKVTADTQAAMQWEMAMPPAHSDMINEINTHQRQGVFYGPE